MFYPSALIGLETGPGLTGVRREALGAGRGSWIRVQRAAKTHLSVRGYPVALIISCEVRLAHGDLVSRRLRSALVKKPATLATVAPLMATASYPGGPLLLMPTSIRDRHTLNLNSKPYIGL